MLLEIKVLVLTIALISFSLTVTSDIIVQPGYGKVPTQHSPIHSQSLLKPSQQQRESEFGHTQAQLIPVYANGYQGGIPYQVGHPLLHYPHYPHYPYYPHYPQYVHALPRQAPRRHLRVLKIGGHKVFQPSWYVGQPSIPVLIQAVHHRHKKSIEDQSDSGKSGETVHSPKDSSIESTLRSDMIKDEDNVHSHQSKDNHATMGQSKDKHTLYGLNAAHLMNSENLEVKLNTPNERNVDENDKLATKEPESNVDKASSSVLKQPDSQVDESSSQIPPDEPHLQNFPDPRPDTPEHKTSHKTTSNPIAKNSLQEKPFLGTSITNDESFESKYVQQEYPTPLAYDYYNFPSCDNYAPPPAIHLPVYVIRYGACNDDTLKTYGVQHSGIQEQIYHTGAIHATDYPPNMGYTFSPQTYNYVSNYALRYPETPHYATSPYPISYLKFH